MKGLIALLFVFNNAVHSLEFSFSDDNEPTALGLEQRLLPLLNRSTIEILIPVRGQTGHHRIDLDDKPEAAVSAITLGRWEPEIRSSLLNEQLLTCLDNEIQHCEVYDQLFPNKAIAIEDKGQTYILIRGDIADQVRSERGNDPVVDVTTLEDATAVPFGLYSIADNDLLSSQLTYLGTYSPLYRDSNRMISKARYWVFSANIERSPSSLSIGISSLDCDNWVLNPPPRPSLMGMICKKGHKLYIEGLLNVSVLQQAIGELEGVTKIELNSGGGEFYSSTKVAALSLAALIREMGITTSLREGAYCGSLCTLLYQAGEGRIAHPTAELMYHGPQWRDKARELSRACDSQHFDLELCQSLQNEAEALNSEFFELLEHYGMSATLLERYLAQPEDSQWLSVGNLMRVQDLFLSPKEAYQFNAVLRTTNSN
jgi:hypothetical protein